MSWVEYGSEFILMPNIWNFSFGIAGVGGHDVIEGHGVLFLHQEKFLNLSILKYENFNSIYCWFITHCFSSCTRTANKTGPCSVSEVPADIEIGDQVRGEGTRAELLGFIRWGDPGRATFTARQQERDLGGAVVKQSMQSAVYDALGGQPDHFIVDPHFHTVEHNFLVFKTAKTSVVGRKAKR